MKSPNTWRVAWCFCAAFASGSASAAGFTTLGPSAWNAPAVKRVLHTFAYGSQATEDQINRWADMPPEVAIQEMLTFGEHNLKLSPVNPADTDSLSKRDGTLRGLRSFWNSSTVGNATTPSAKRRDYDETTAFQMPARVWIRATRSRGLNPFRQRVGLWETNYHLAVNTAAGVQYNQVLRYYDDIMAGLSAGQPYEQVLTTAAESAAVATQYGHRFNQIVGGNCQCNEDFAREYHQLFFGILGDYDPVVHEQQTIKDTARILTGMPVGSTSTGLADVVDFTSKSHDTGALTVLEATVQGQTAKDDLATLGPIAIAHPESLANLPVKIIAGLADDALDETKIQAIREAWAAMPQKNLLQFLRSYAISKTFHSKSRVRYLSSIDRHLLIAVQTNQSNVEGGLELVTPQYGLNQEGITLFQPIHNVFGHQTGEEAVGSAGVFRAAYDRATEQSYQLADPIGGGYHRDMRTTFQKGPTNGYEVERIGTQLWSRFISDGMRNYGPLERAAVVGFLARGLDLATLLFPGDPEHVVTSADVQANRAKIDALSLETMALDNTKADQRLTANQRVMMAINFITATPFMFYEEGR